MAPLSILLFKFSQNEEGDDIIGKRVSVRRGPASFGYALPYRFKDRQRVVITGHMSAFPTDSEFRQ
ncbi:MAG: hypothetical protein CVT77_01985 [Alphaproteobacteria bacterium HGW-Alphaproteobacteria-16]|nr:MAG: hypothetical protein CVT77_01985 [Alphaproteobacteria bacterium HGW-Alphaproteobacteria-16]